MSHLNISFSDLHLLPSWQKTTLTLVGVVLVVVAYVAMCGILIGATVLFGGFIK